RPARPRRGAGRSPAAATGPARDPHRQGRAPGPDGLRGPCDGDEGDQAPLPTGHQGAAWDRLLAAPWNRAPTGATHRAPTGWSEESGPYGRPVAAAWASTARIVSYDTAPSKCSKMGFSPSAPVLPAASRTRA